MKKILLILISLLALQLGAFDLQWNGILEESLDFTGKTDTTWNYNSTLSLGMEGTISPNLSLFGAASGTFRYYEDIASDDMLRGDISKLYLRFRSSDLEVKGGRMNFRDATGYVLNLNLDGLQLSYEIDPNISITGGAGFSGLTFYHSSLLNKTKQERSEDGLLAPSRMVWLLQGNYQTDRGALAQVNSYGQFGLEETGRELMTWYAGIGGIYPMGDLALQGWYTFNGGWNPYYHSGAEEVRGQALAAHLVKIGFQWYPTNLKEQGFHLSVTGLYTSGDDYTTRSSALPGTETSTDFTGTSTSYTPMSNSTLGSLLAALPGNVVQTRMELGFIPVRDSFDQNILGINLGTSVFLRPVNGPVTVDEYNEDSNNNYLGTEIDLSFTFRPFSDLGIKLDGAVFMPNTASGGTFEGGREDLEWKMGIYAALGF